MVIYDLICDAEHRFEGWFQSPEDSERQAANGLISCPTCGRCEMDIPKMVAAIEKKLSTLDRELKIAVMGCVVNGPGEAREADLGMAGGKGVGVLFKKGKIIKKLKEKDIVSVLVKEAQSM